MSRTAGRVAPAPRIPLWPEYCRVRKYSRSGSGRRTGGRASDERRPGSFHLVQFTIYLLSLRRLPHAQPFGSGSERGAREASVKRLTMLVTPDGRWVLPNTEEFLAVLGDSAPDYDAISFAVKNLGFIKLQIIEQSIIEIELHPRNVELPALLAAQQQLLSARIKLFRIKYFDAAWHSEISSSAEHAIARLSALCTPVFTPATHERFIVEPQDFGQLFHDDE